jgi:hypothetical protein
VSAGRGAKGHRLYDWALIRLDDRDPAPGRRAGRRWLLVRRNRTTGELAFYHCWTPRPVAVATLIRVAGRRWTTLAMLACASSWCSRPRTAPATLHRPG